MSQEEVNANQAAFGDAAGKLSHRNRHQQFLFRHLLPLRNAKCHNTACNSKGKRVMARRFMFPLMVLASSFNAASQE
jgi:hypothetical protein